MNPLPGIPSVESPLFERLVKDFPPDLKRIARDIHLKGFSVIDFPDPDFVENAERIKEQLNDEVFMKEHAPRRIQDAWKTNQQVRDIAANPVILDMLSKLYGRKAIPFQTLNFKFGSEQHYHSDAVHFSSSPERFMCGVWVALEDIKEINGPLMYFPGSHTWPILSNEMIDYNVLEEASPTQYIYHDAWKALIDTHNVKPEVFLAKKGQALIWAANLLHGGLPIIDKNHTRWSQVTHYFFENCCYYTPMWSNLFLGNVLYKNIHNIETGAPVENCSCGRLVTDSGLPKNFDPAVYLRLNEDVKASGIDPAEHWLKHGRFEARRYTISRLEL